eukprot:9056187-Karenia_brevis.AAC.1
MRLAAQRQGRSHHIAVEAATSKSGKVIGRITSVPALLQSWLQQCTARPYKTIIYLRPFHVPCE